MGDDAVLKRYMIFLIPRIAPFGKLKIYGVLQMQYTSLSFIIDTPLGVSLEKYQ